MARSRSLLVNETLGSPVSFQVILGEDNQIHVISLDPSNSSSQSFGFTHLSSGPLPYNCGDLAVYSSKSYY